MKKRLMLFVIFAVLAIFAVSASALPQNCPYCGQPVSEYDSDIYHTETYSVPCSNMNLFGSDQVTVTYRIDRTFCSNCHHIKYERWWEQSRTTTCQGWRNPPYIPVEEPAIDTVKK